MAESKIAVVDLEEAVAKSDAGKHFTDSVNSAMKPQQDRMAELKSQIDADTLKAQRDDAVMSDKEKKDLSQDYSAKVNQYQHIQQDMQRSYNEARDSFLERVGPKAKAILDGLIKAGGYTLVLSKNAAYYSGGTPDLTPKVTEKLNSMPADAATAPAAPAAGGK